MSSLLAAQCNGVSPCGPVKRALTSAPGSSERRDLGGRFGHVSRPVGDDVQQRPGLSVLGVAEPCGRKVGMLAQELFQRGGVTGLDRLGDLARERRVRVQPRRDAGHADLRARRLSARVGRPAPASAAARSG